MLAGHLCPNTGAAGHPKLTVCQGCDHADKQRLPGLPLLISLR